jgi:hypothetical protein
MSKGIVEVKEINDGVLADVDLAKREIIVVEQEQAKIVQDLVDWIQATEISIKALEKNQDAYRSQLTEAMGNLKISKIENDQFEVAYFPENVKMILDSAKLKAEHEEVYIQCMKQSTTKPFVKIKLK